MPDGRCRVAWNYAKQSGTGRNRAFRGDMQQVITANRLRDGVVVFVAAEHRWVERLADAAVFYSVDAAAAALQSAHEDESANTVLDIYAVDVIERGGNLRPAKLREAIRAQGPTVHPEHGKLAGQVRHG